MAILTGKRLALSQLMTATLADESAHHCWTYHAVRPMPVPPTWKPGSRVTGDCSKGVQYLCKWVGAPDPMRQNYDTWGNSGTLWLRLAHAASAADLKVGDIVVFGPYGSEHAAMVYKAGVDPLLWSFGEQGAPNTYRLSTDTRVKTFLKLPLIDPPPTPQEKLRAMTGYYSWIAWKLGEGPWKSYAPAAPGVRPDVPKLIPLSWWKAYAQFLLARKQGS